VAPSSVGVATICGIDMLRPLDGADEAATGNKTGARIHLKRQAVRRRSALDVIAIRRQM